MSLRNYQRLLLWLAVAAVVVLLDQWSKGVAQEQLEYGRAVVILPVFNFYLQYNSGAAFSFLQDAGGWQRWFFSAIALGASVFIGIWLSRLQRGEWLLAWSLSFIMGGALGNLWDRLALGHVVDFISVHYGDAYFPAFNIADSAITVGAVLMIVDSLLRSRQVEDKS